MKKDLMLISRTLLMKILVLRVYNPSEEYDRMKDVHMKYDDSIFITLNPNLENEWNYDSEKRLLEMKGEESFNPGLRVKTFKALEICLSLFDFDYLVRSNMSTVIDLKLLEEKLGYLKGKSVYGGHAWNLQYEDLYSGITKEMLAKYNNLPYISGTSIILSKDNCSFIVENHSKLTDNIVDDVAIGAIMKNKQLPNLYLRFEDGPSLDKSIVFFRFKRNEDRYKDYLRIAEQYQLLKD